MSTYHVLTEDEIQNPKEIKLPKEVDTGIEVNIGENTKSEELSEAGVDTPHLPLYADDNDEAITPTSDRDDTGYDQYD